MFTNPIAFMRFAAPGTVCLVRQQIRGAWELAWLIRERSAWVEQLGCQPEVEFRAELFWEAGVGLLPMLVRVGPASHCKVYESWVNEHAPSQSGTLATLAEQPSLAVDLYVDECRLGRSLVLINGIQDFARQALAEITARPAWSMQDFDRARDQLRRQYPEPWDLWRQIGRESASR